MPTTRKRNEIKLPASFVPFFWSDADQRSVVVREIKRRYKQLKHDSGADSYQKDLLVRRAVFITLQLETMEVEAVREKVPFELGVYTQLVNTLIGLLKSLGLDRKDLSTLVNLKDYVQAKGGKERDPMNILEAIQDENLFLPFLGKLTTWRNWLACLRVVYGLPVPAKRHAVVAHCTGRSVDQFPSTGFDTALFLTGRRSGKSRIAAVIGAYEAALAGHETKLAKGERGVVAVCAPTKPQSRIVRDYLRAIFEPPILASEVTAETREGFELRNGNRIQILTGDFRTVRGFTLLAAIVDEAAFFGYDVDTKVKSDTELVRALKPSLATVGGKLLAISSPYARKGWCYTTHRKHFGNDLSSTLVVNCPSRTLNPTLPESVVAQAMEEDLQAAKSEYGGEFRDDVAEFLPRTVIEQVVVRGRRELLPRELAQDDGRRAYHAFVDLSGGRKDDAALAIGHKVGRVVVLDLLKRYAPPFNPIEVIGRMADEVKRYGIRKVVGDNYSADFCARAFESTGVRYQKSEKPKAALYQELLPRLCSREIELLDDPHLVNQLASLERRTRSGGRDIIDHPPGGHDDLANVVAGITDSLASKNVRVVGLF